MYLSRDRVRRFQQVGRLLFGQGLVDSHSGNLSEFDGDLWITRAGSTLGELASDDIVRMTDPDSPEQTARASSELIVHRAIYAARSAARAVVHAHPTFATVKAAGAERIVPFDSESELLLGGAVDVVCVEPPGASPEAAAAVAAVLAGKTAVVVRRHGAFVVSDVGLDDALRRMSALEHAARLLYYRDLKPS